MRRLVDLHTHSTCSDGQYRPAEVVRMADRVELAAVALTDHDTLSGLAEARSAAAELPELRFVGGIEVSAKFPNGTLHILGLGVDEHAPSIQRLGQLLRDARNRRNPRMIERLRGLGLEIGMDDVLAVAREGDDRGDDERIVGRLHMAETLRRKGHARTTQEAFDRYVGHDAPGYVDKERMEPGETIAAIREAGGAAVLAHPVQLGLSDDDRLEAAVRDFVDQGLNGIEAYHSDHDARQTRFYLELAERYGLLVSGGSDFHGAAKPEASLGHPRVPLSVVEPLLAAVRH
jgi:predicted metal-dependent phosphoesterase TrpH